MNILEISYRSAEPEIARIVADALRDAYVDSNLSARREEARRNAEWFEGQAAEARAKLAEAEKTKAAFEKANNIILQQDNNDIDSLRLAALAGTSTPRSEANTSELPSLIRITYVVFCLKKKTQF